MASKYILNYFPITGRAEPGRLMFHVAGVEFTDNQIPFAEWPQHKVNPAVAPLGHLPTVQVDGQVITESKAVNRFIANRLNLAGDSDIDKAVADQVYEVIADLFEATTKIIQQKDVSSEEQTKQIAEFFGSAGTVAHLQFIKSKLEYKSGSFFLGYKVSMIDCVFFGMYEYWVAGYPAIVDDYPEFAALHKAISEVEPIKNYLSTRTLGLVPGQ